MTSYEITLENSTGLHARPASLLIECVKKYKSEVMILKDGNQYNAKSMMSILSMGADQGTTLTFEVDGSDEQEALDAIIGLIKSGFGE